MIFINRSNLGPLPWSLISPGASLADIRKASWLLARVGLEERLRRLVAWWRDKWFGK